MSPASVGGRNRCFCSGVPNAMITGETMLMANGRIGTVPARANSSAKMKRCTGVQPGPPYSTGQAGATQPLAANILCQAR